MTSKPISIHPEKSVDDALSMMLEIRCHHLPVMSQSKHLVGLVSDYNCHKALSEQSPQIKPPKSQKIRIRDVMTVAPAVIAPESSVIEAAKLMFENNIRCLPVMRDETLVGIITTSDLLIAFINMSQNQMVSNDHLEDTHISRSGTSNQ